MTAEERAGLIDKLTQKEYEGSRMKGIGSLLINHISNLPSDLASTIIEAGYEKWKQQKTYAALIEKLNAATDDQLVAMMLSNGNE